MDEKTNERSIANELHNKINSRNIIETMLNKKLGSQILKQEQNIRFFTTKIQTVKSLKNLNEETENDSQEGLEDSNKKTQECTENSITLASSKSASKIYSNNSFIKIDRELIKSCNMLTPHLSSPILEKNKYKDNICRSTIQQSPNLLNGVEDSSKKKPKFIRCKNSDKKETNFNHSVEKNSRTSENLVGKIEEVITENIKLKRKDEDNEKKIDCLLKRVEEMSFTKNIQRIKQLERENKELESQLFIKEEHIKEISSKLAILEEENNDIERKYTDLQQEQEIFKSSLSSFDLDDSGIKADMLSTAEYIESLTDLEDELQKRKVEIFGLNQLVEQLRMKNHFQEIRHEENMLRCKDEWDYKYKNLLQMYRTLKSSKGEISRKMSKRKTKTEFMDVEKEELFNLSLSTDRSQAINY